MPSCRDPAAISVEIVINLLTNHVMVAAMARLVNMAHGFAAGIGERRWRTMARQSL